MTPFKTSERVHSRQSVLETLNSDSRTLWLLPEGIAAHELPKQGEGKKEDDVALRQWSPTFLPSGVGFVEDNFAIDQGRGMVSE